MRGDDEGLIMQIFIVFLNVISIRIGLKADPNPVPYFSTNAIPVQALSSHFLVYYYYYLKCLLRFYNIIL